MIRLLQRWKRIRLLRLQLQKELQIFRLRCREMLRPLRLQPWEMLHTLAVSSLSLVPWRPEYPPPVWVSLGESPTASGADNRRRSRSPSINTSVDRRRSYAGTSAAPLRGLFPLRHECPTPVWASLDQSPTASGVDNARRSRSSSANKPVDHRRYRTGL